MSVAARPASRARAHQLGWPDDLMERITAPEAAAELIALLDSVGIDRLPGLNGGLVHLAEDRLAIRGSTRRRILLPWLFANHALGRVRLSIDRATTAAA